MQTLRATITGINPLLQNNPQTVDRFNPYAKSMARINAKKTRRTDDDYRELQDIEVRSKLYFDDEVGVYVPATWVISSIASNSFRVAKISKADIRGSVFMMEDVLPLQYRNMEKVKTPDDIVGNPEFRQKMTLKQGQVRIVKAMPIFHKWSFTFDMEYDDKMIDPESLEGIIKHASKYGGYGDFRPTFGRAVAEVNHV